MKTYHTLFALLCVFLAWLFFLAEPLVSGQSYNSTWLLNTTVNITNSAPLVLDVNLQSPINLIAYDNTTVNCNVTIYDFDNNTAGVNATLHRSNMSSSLAPDMNYLYTNSSCSLISPADYYANYSCTFTVNYFANNGSWLCNATVIDVANATGSNQSVASIINPLIAIKLPSLIDYGNVAVNQNSTDIDANITNAGNRDANISVEGYAIVPGDNLAMNCTVGTIAIGFEKYNRNGNINYGAMTALTGVTTQIPIYSVYQRQSETIESINATYWKMSVPPGAGGICTGKILFTASDRGN
ncbi:MAG: hypothetical protein HGA85_03550 [Nanoarchaeota archaeon]|nr:hypothetical protein [Nanoarchaeota archaeon]